MDSIILYLIKNDIIKPGFYDSWTSIYESASMKGLGWYVENKIKVCRSEIEFSPFDKLDHFQVQLLYRFVKKDWELFMELFQMTNTKIFSVSCIFIFCINNGLMDYIYYLLPFVHKSSTNNKRAIVNSPIPLKDKMELLIRFDNNLGTFCIISESNQHELAVQWIQYHSHLCTQFLDCAIKENDVDMVSLLIDYGAEISYNDCIQLSNAINSNREAVIQYLMSKGYYHGSIIKYYCCTGNKMALDLIFQHGIDMKHIDSIDIWNLMLKDWNQIYPLISLGFDLSYGNYCCIETCARLSNISVLKNLLDIIDLKYVDLGVILFNYCQSRNNLEIVKLLIQYGADVNTEKNGFSVFRYCLRPDGVAISHLLLELSVNITEIDILTATIRGIEPIVYRLLEYRYSQETIDLMLYQITNSQRVEVTNYEDALFNIFRQLINDYNADVNAHNSIIYAAIHGYEKLVQLFLQAGADIHADNDAALIFASFFGHTKIVQILLEFGADIDPLTPELDYNQDIEMLDSEQKMFDDCLSASRYKPLVIAAAFEHWDICKLLIEYGSDAGLVDKINE
jgi:ankyrin repeat protein